LKDTEVIVLRRISCIDKAMLDEIIERFKLYGVSFYNSYGDFDYQNVRAQCIDMANVLYKNEEPINGIRYQFCDFMSIIQSFVGIRNISSFMHNG